MVFKSLSSLPSHFRVITGLELALREDRPLGAKTQKTMQFGDFHAEQSSGATRVLVPAAEISKEVSKYFGILPRASPFYSQAVIDLHIYLFLFFIIIGR